MTRRLEKGRSARARKTAGGPAVAAGRPTAKVAEVVARNIARRIGSEKLVPGTQLESEAQMLVKYGVARASLREALRILEVHGLITIKAGPGGGAVVAGVSTRDFGRMATLYFQAGTMTFRELIEARLVMEPVMARLAAERSDAALIERLLALSIPLESDEAYLHTSAEFHRLVASMSDNRILNLFSHSLEDIFHDRVSGMLFPVSRRAKVVAVHAAIARAIARGEAAKAERLMREHMLEYARYVERRHPALMDEVVDWR
ncbi:MAG: FadR family transcriptional regulator [Betaproteobacteria bacterium]|nr:FadR family transcriptional regulator [Betaproteobacteria bacterium]